jgi:hypothetical protein
MPEPEAGGEGEGAEGEKLPCRGAVAEDVAGVADVCQGAEADVGAVGDKAEASEEISVGA